MPLTKKQKRLFGWVYACKTGKSKRCPSRIKKIGKNISKKRLRKCLKESYIIKPISVIDKKFITRYLNEKNIKYFKFYKYLIINKNYINTNLFEKKFSNRFVKINIII